MKPFPIDSAIATLGAALADRPLPLIEAMRVKGESPFKILIATLLSLRTKDSITAQVAPQLFALADTPQTMLKLAPRAVERAIYRAGFHRKKARVILAVCRQLVDCFNGQVPADLNLLLSLPGVGRKTANLVLSAAFGLPGLCVDVHVHRISNRWGYVRTQTPEATETALRRNLPFRHWAEYNRLLVTLGQTVCLPTSPW
ncbi:MAG: endonuclease III domain-containing protein, partial [Anaerolineae bacterium]